MAKGKLIVFVIFAAAVALMIGNNMRRTDRTPPSAAPTTQPGRQPSPDGQIHGMALQLHYGNSGHPYEEVLREIPASGTNTVCFVVHAYQENASSTSIFIDRRKTPSNARLAGLIARAHELGMRAILMPVVLLENARSGEWRGKIDPPDWNAWWEDYTNVITYYAKVAAAAEADLFVIGSELVSTETQTERWRELISTVRWLYPGRISYSANWDHYRPIAWWDAVDIIGMTTYYDLTGGEPPTLDRLVQAWVPIREEMLTWQQNHHPDKPIMFTEVGWPNQETCAQYPWNYYAAPDKPDPQAQANCFEAFFETWIDEPAVAGFIVWEWRVDPTKHVGPEDTSYTPCGKPAMDVIRRYYQGRHTADRPTSRPAADVAVSPDAAGPPGG